MLIMDTTPKHTDRNYANGVSSLFSPSGVLSMAADLESIVGSLNVRMPGSITSIVFESAMNDSPRFMKPS
jgi:hypothetical protein